MKTITLFAVIFLLSSSIFAKNLKEAYYYTSIDGKIVQCHLCPRECVINENKRGNCNVRENIGGKLFSLVYGKPVSIAVDPIEKKPVFHCLPGSKSFSFATVGCNLRCIHCQNWQISQAAPEDVKSYEFSPEQIVDMAMKSGCRSIAYTYTEPTVFFEYMLDVCKIAKQKKIKNIMVTSGYINYEPMKELCKYLDVGRVDLKGFSDEFYRKVAAAKLQPVLDTLKVLKKNKVWIEIINLIIPGYNDDYSTIEKMCKWIVVNLGTDYPLYFSRFQPQFKLSMIQPTPISTLEKAREIALKAGLRFVYIGNVPGHPAENTYCPNCKKIVIGRTGYTITENNLEKGKCKYCKTSIPGIW